MVSRSLICLGIPVVYEPKLESVSITLDKTRWWFPWRFMKIAGIVEQRGVLKWKRIVAGPSLRAFPEREQAAIILHEVGHAKLKHIERRILNAWRILLCPAAFARLCVAQELQADYFAAECGYAAELASALARLNSDTRASLHPAVGDRIARLLAWRSKE